MSTISLMTMVRSLASHHSLLPPIEMATRAAWPRTHRFGACSVRIDPPPLYVVVVLSSAHALLVYLTLCGDAGDQELQVPATSIRLPQSAAFAFKVGDAVEALYNGGEEWFPGRISTACLCFCFCFHTLIISPHLAMLSLIALAMRGKVWRLVLGLGSLPRG